MCRLRSNGSSAWLKLVERWFRELTDKALWRCISQPVSDPFAAIEDHLADYDEPKPLVWTATGGSILEEVARGRVAFQTVNQD